MVGSIALVGLAWPGLAGLGLAWLGVVGFVGLVDLVGGWLVGLVCLASLGLAWFGLF